jgi:Ion transport protein
LDPEYILEPSDEPITQSWCEAGSHIINASSSLYHASIPRSSLPATSELESGNIYTLEHHWVKPPGNFDNIFRALLTLFEIATTEMWPDYMYMAVDATYPGQQPIYRSRPANALYFILFIIVGSFFVLKLFVGVAIDKFNQMQAEHLGQNLTLTPAQEQWVTVQRMMAKAKAPRSHEKPKNPYQAAVFHVCLPQSSEYLSESIETSILRKWKV